MMASGTCTLDRYGSAGSMNERGALNQRADDRGDVRQRVEAAGVVDAQTAPTNSLENAQTAFPTDRMNRLAPLSEVVACAPQLC